MAVHTQRRHTRVLREVQVNGAGWTEVDLSGSGNVFQVRGRSEMGLEKHRVQKRMLRKSRDEHIHAAGKVGLRQDPGGSRGGRVRWGLWGVREAGLGPECEGCWAEEGALLCGWQVNHGVGGAWFGKVRLAVACREE